MRFSLAALFLLLPALPGQATAQLAIRVNLPAYRLDLLDSGRVIRRIPIAIGDSAYPSRIGRFTIRRITWDPTWTPPSGEPWAAGDTVMGPGGANPMGVVKLALGGTYYIHGTPEPRSVGSAASHGCIRLRNRDVAAVARYLERATGTVEPERDHTHPVPRPVTLGVPVPVVVTYQLVERRGARLRVYRDVYGLRTASTDSAAARIIAGGPFTSRAFELARQLLDSARAGSLDARADSVRRAATSQP